jgi:ubiquinone/menaquinone biosynthesis C-methylase UbiE
MNNAIRRWGQRYAASWMERLGGRVDGGRVLEVGCGGGAGAEIIFELFGAVFIQAVDLDPQMVERARRRLAVYGPSRVRVSVGNLTSIQAADGSFDAVFDFGAIHLEPEWRRGISEVRRVLKPGGKFFFEWVTGRFLRSPYPLVTESFGRMEVPGPTELRHEIEERGLIIGGKFAQPRLAAVTGFVGDIIGVGVAAESTKAILAPC